MPYFRCRDPQKIIEVIPKLLGNRKFLALEPEDLGSFLGCAIYQLGDLEQVTSFGASMSSP